MRRRSRRKPGLLTWKDILPWQRDNEFILTGYRRASFSYMESLKSALGIHNETVNIWSHLLGAVLFLAMLIQYVISVWRSVSTSSGRFGDMMAVSVYYACVVVCFTLSTAFHTFSDHSPEMHRFGNELDHLGIVLVMWGTGVSGTYFAYRCETGLRNVYLVVLSAVAYGCGVFTLRPKFRKPVYRTMRFLMYVFLGTSLYAPVIHGGIRYGWPQLNQLMGLESYLGLAVVNFSGAAIYAARIPERWFPKAFDLAGHSHNWMHVLVLGGALVRLRGLLDVSAQSLLDDHETACKKIFHRF